MSGTTTEAAAEVRAAFKAQGWTARQIGVRADYFSLGSALRVTLKDGAIPLHKVKAIAEGKERIRRDGYGEILGGGNRYVTIDVAEEARAIKVRRNIEAVERAIELLPPAPTNTLQEIVPGYCVGRGINGYGLALWGETSHIAQCETADGIAFRLATEEEKRQDQRAA